MPKVKNVGDGVYADGVLYVHAGEEIEVSEEKAKYLCDKDSPGKFELVKVEAQRASRPTPHPEKK